MMKGNKRKGNGLVRKMLLPVLLLACFTFLIAGLILAGIVPESRISILTSASFAVVCLAAFWAENRCGLNFWNCVCLIAILSFGLLLVGFVIMDGGARAACKVSVNAVSAFGISLVSFVCLKGKGRNKIRKWKQ